MVRPIAIFWGKWNTRVKSGKPVSLSEVIKQGVGRYGRGKWTWTCVFRATLMGAHVRMAQFVVPLLFHLPRVFRAICFESLDSLGARIINITLGQVLGRLWHIYMEFPSRWSLASLLWLIDSWPALNISSCLPYLRQGQSRSATHLYLYPLRANTEMMSSNFNFIYHQFFMHPFRLYVSTSKFAAFSFSF